MSHLPNGAYVSSPSQCQRICLISPSCTYFSWWKEGTALRQDLMLSPGGCWLLGPNAKLTPGLGWFSGPKACPNSTTAASQSPPPPAESATQVLSKARPDVNATTTTKGAAVVWSWGTVTVTDYPELTKPPASTTLTTPKPRF